MSEISFGNIILAQTGKKGILLPDANGNYRLNGGAFNVENAHGIRYPANEYILSQMDSNSDLNRRVKMGYCKMEVEHPEPFTYVIENGVKYRKPITSLIEWIARLRNYDDTRICGLISQIIFTPEDDNDLTKAIWYEIICKPFGPRGPEFKESLDTPEHNTAVSIRTQISPFVPESKKKNVEYWTGNDWVSDPGMIHANKHMSSGCESFLSGFGLNDNMIKFKVSDMIEILDNEIIVANTGVEALERVGGMEALNYYTDVLKNLKDKYKYGDTLTVASSFTDIF